MRARGYKRRWELCVSIWRRKRKERARRKRWRKEVANEVEGLYRKYDVENNKEQYMKVTCFIIQRRRRRRKEQARRKRRDKRSKVTRWKVFIGNRT